MNVSDWTSSIGPNITRWLEILAYLIGMVISLQAYRRSRKCGYILVAVYFVFGICALTVVPAVNRAITQKSHSQYELSPEIQKQYVHDAEALRQKYFPGATTAGAIHIKFPIGPLILLIGIWALAREESQKRPVSSATET